MRVISIIPNLPPTIDGLGDYALSLARVMSDAFSIETHFVVGNHKWQGARSIDGYSIDRINRRSQNELLKIFDRISDQQDGEITIFLNLAIYGYARWGTPFWLVSAIESYRALAPKVRIVTMFHELSNPPGAPWRHMFWTARAQLEVLRRIFDASDVVVTSNAKYADILHQLVGNPGASIELFPVASNIGEVANPKALHDRQRRLVVFGQRGSRMNAYREGQAQMAQVCQDLQIESIVDIGPTVDLPYAVIRDIRIQSLGERSAAEVSAIMADSIAGFMQYDSSLLAKSGIFAAYSAHGLLPVVCARGGQKNDGLSADINYLSLWHTRIPSITIETAQTIAKNAHQWYSNHNLCAQGDFFAMTLSGVGVVQHPCLSRSEGK
jgi:hypothetical protein